jgi:isopenicillin-N epimerase
MALRDLWTLEKDVTYLNHGSFGACPASVLAEQARLRARLEAQPVRFMLRELEPMLDAARAALAAFLGADAADLGFVPNATTGVNAVLRSLTFAPGDEIVTTDHAYGACRNALDYVAARSGARVVVATVPFPLRGPDEVVTPILAAVGDRTRLALLDHVTSPTALVWPLAELVTKLRARGVETLVDGAHAPGMIPLALDGLGAGYYTGNCHKWLCAPKGAAFLHVRRDLQSGLVPTTVSHGATSSRTDKSRFQLLFDWVGTTDPTAALCVPAALAFMGSLQPGGWPKVMAANHALALHARDRLCAALGVSPPAPGAMLGSMASIPLPDEAVRAEGLDPLQDSLWHQDRIEVPVHVWPAPPRRLIRVSAQLYNGAEDYDRLAAALGRLARTGARRGSAVQK